MKLSFTWLAVFEDGTQIKQFDNGKENRFAEVQARFDKLQRFTLFSNIKAFTVDLTQGLIYFNRHQKTQTELLTKKSNIRLIYFRRNTVEYSQSTLEKISHRILYFLGFQYIDEHKHNQKILLQIDKHGNFIIGS